MNKNASVTFRLLGLFISLVSLVLFFLYEHPGITFSRKTARMVSIRTSLSVASIFLSDYIKEHGSLPTYSSLQKAILQNSCSNIEMTYLILDKKNNYYFLAITDLENDVSVIEPKSRETGALFFDVR